jgi:hypothetical protein
MESLRYDRLYRTPSSEAYLLSEGEDALGRLELHYGSNNVYGLLILDGERAEDDVLDLIEQIDDDLVLTADVAREDFMVTVYQGREIGLYSDPRDDLDEDDLDDDADEDEAEGNGRH